MTQPARATTADLARTRMTRARAALQRGDVAAARRLLHPLIEAATEPEIIALYADAALLEGRIEGLGEVLRAKAQPLEGLAKAGLLRRASEALMRQMRAAEAATLALQAVEAAPEDIDVAETFGRAMLLINKLDEAALVFANVVNRSPQPRRLSLLGLITCLRRQAAFDAADEVITLARSFFPDDVRFQIERAQVLRARGKPEEAKQVLLNLPPSQRASPEVFALLGELHLVLGEDEDAKGAFAQAYRLAPDNAAFRHLSGQRDERACDDYVRSLFDGYAANFEASLIGLGYRVPGLILRGFERIRPDLTEGGKLKGPILDLGCGTGLVSVVLSEVADGPLVGVDLSRQMLGEARAKGQYAELHEAEIGAFLKEDERLWPIVIAADVFCYFGDLREIFGLVRARMPEGGLFCFSVERTDTMPWVKQVVGRYAHHADYVRAALTGFDVLSAEEQVLRIDREEPVNGLLVFARAV